MFYILYYNFRSTFDVDNSLQELAKKKKEGNTPHIRRLLKITLDERRDWIQNTAQNISEIVEKYPQLTNSDLVNCIYVYYYSSVVDLYST